MFDRYGRQPALMLGLGASVLIGTWLTANSQTGRLPPQNTPLMQDMLGPFGPEGPRMREQLWMMPSGTPGVALRATVFRPAERSTGLVKASVGGEPDRRPVVIINHGTSERTRHSVSLPIYYWLSRWFVERGFVVVLPQRRGHGATGGPLVEAVGDCANPDHYTSGRIAADDLQAVVDYVTQQPFAARQVVVAGISTGGWASLALAARNLEPVRAVVNFAGGRGGYAWGRPGEVCAQDRLVAAAGRFGKAAKTPTLWLYSSNDSFFGPELAKAMAGAWNTAGGKADLHVLPPYADDGHSLADDHAGWKLWGARLEAFLGRSLDAGLLAGRHGKIEPASIK